LSKLSLNGGFRPKIGNFAQFLVKKMRSQKSFQHFLHLFPRQKVRSLKKEKGLHHFWTCFPGRKVHSLIKKLKKKSSRLSVPFALKTK